MPANPPGKWVSPYLVGWDRPGANFSALDRGACPEGSRPSANCPRCEERERAGVCPAPGTLGSLIALFPRIYVLCVGGDCARHVGGYWPSAVRDRMRVLDVSALNKQLARVAGPSLAPHLGLGEQKYEGSLMYAQRKRVLPLLSHLHAVHLAARDSLDSVAVMEGDMRPIVNNALKPAEVQQLAMELRGGPWDVLRPSGYFNRAFPRGTSKDKAPTCLPACACRPALRMRRACKVSAQSSLRRDNGANGENVPNFSAPFCDVRNPDLYVARSRTFVAFAQLRERALAALRHAGQLHASGDAAAAQAQLDNTTSLPFIDLWVAARFDALFILPQLAIQHIRQGEAYTSAWFDKRCRVRQV